MFKKYKNKKRATKNGSKWAYKRDFVNEIFTYTFNYLQSVSLASNFGFLSVYINIGITLQLATKSRRKRGNGSRSEVRSYKFYANLHPHKPTPKAAKWTSVGGNL